MPDSPIPKDISQTKDDQRKIKIINFPAVNGRKMNASYYEIYPEYSVTTNKIYCLTCRQFGFNNDLDRPVAFDDDFRNAWKCSRKVKKNSARFSVHPLFSSLP